MKIKYPRTYHLPWSPGCTSDDKIQSDLSNFVGKQIVVTEKMDGENTTMMRDSYYARSLDSNNHPSRNYVKGMWGNIRYNIPDSHHRICGENLYAKHSIEYDDLEDYFLVFSMWNVDTCLAWEVTLVLCKLIGLKTVPVLYQGIYDEDVIKDITDNLDTSKQEGIVVRLSDSFKLEDFNRSCVKWVRGNHVQTDEHWTKGEIIKNGLKNE